ncbi:MAG: aminotransferase class I/II-fold pyridoxal phosphate-dependent enzyme [Xanthobacteraceae bacterium]|nr:MAG: aminotransferase class I/II-fold pyridoxal phosphate-dependent enzyme [Xanthobacteraceae bacterium]
MVGSAPSPASAVPGFRLGERSPFARLAALLGTTEPGQPVISLAVGEPQHPVPPFVAPVLAGHIAEFGRYPLSRGIEPFRRAAAGWLTRRFALARAVDPETEILVLNGSREGLFYAALAARNFLGERAGRPAILMPNPFYPAYLVAAQAAGCEPVLLPATRHTGFLPDLDALDETLLARTLAFYIASPANPQGSVASPAYFARLRGLAERFGFLVFSDECYSEIYTGEAPSSMLAVAGGDFANVVAFQSLSKRSNLPGLRVGFVAGDRRFIASFHELRNIVAPQVPVPAQHVAVAAYQDEAHVADNRRRYAEKFALADAILGGRYGYHRPAGGFCLWLDVSAQGGDEAAALRLWKQAGVRVVPGSYLARAKAPDGNPGDGYIRVALVQDSDITAEALRRLVGVLG